MIVYASVYASVCTRLCVGVCVYMSEPMMVSKLYFMFRLHFTQLTGQKIYQMLLTETIAWVLRSLPTRACTEDGKMGIGESNKPRHRKKKLLSDWC